MPSRWKFWNGHFGALIGIWWKLAVPRRDFCVSRYENSRPCSSGSSEKSMPGMTLRRQERDLLGLGEEVVGPAVEHHAADDRAAARPLPG